MDCWQVKQGPKKCQREEEVKASCTFQSTGSMEICAEESAPSTYDRQLHDLSVSVFLFQLRVDLFASSTNASTSKLQRIVMV